MDAAFIYQSRSSGRVSTAEMRGGPDGLIVYVNGSSARWTVRQRSRFPISRWKLGQIGFGRVVTALKGKGAAAYSVVALPADPQPQALPEPTFEVVESQEARFERLLEEMRELTR